MPGPRAAGPLPRHRDPAADGSAGCWLSVGVAVAVPRYRCDTVECGRAVFNQDLGKLACPRSSTTRRCARYVLRRLMIDGTTISAIAAELGVSWHTVSSMGAMTGPSRCGRASSSSRRWPLAPRLLLLVRDVVAGGDLVDFHRIESAVGQHGGPGFE